MACVHQGGGQLITKEQPTVPQWICTHCFIHLVNGDCTEPFTCPEGVDVGDRTTDTPMPMHLFGDMHVTPGMLWEHHSDACYASAENGYEECDCEIKTFSWSACDGCGSNLGGSRHAVPGWIKGDK